MVAALVVLLCTVLVVAVGESVRTQCRRMLSRPLVVPAQDESAEPATAPATA